MSKVKNPKVPIKTDPMPLDVAFDEIGEGLKEKLPWLTNTYGKVERLVRTQGKTKVVYPAIYVGGNMGEDYLSMLPDTHLGSYMFCELEKEEVDHKPRQYRNGKVEANLVFFFDYRKVYTDHVGMTIENVKQDILNAIDDIIFPTVRMRILEFQEGANNVYRSYTHNEIKSQFMMRPYGALKIKIKFNYRQNC